MENQNIVSSWIEISETDLEHNIASYKSIIGKAKLAVIIKSNAYGCGLSLVAKLFAQNPQVDYLCVVSLAEAVYLRTLGIDKNILVLGIIDCDLVQAVNHDIELAIYDLPTLLMLDQIAKSKHKKVKIHLKIDTGMSRLGFFYDQIPELMAVVSDLKFIQINGIFTHYAASDSADLTYLHKQANLFDQVLAYFKNQKIELPLVHTANSAAINAISFTHFNLVRLGIGAYGLWPSPENRVLTLNQHSKFNLKFPLTWKTKIISIKELAQDSYVGYDLSYRATKKIKTAIVPVGYYDGYDRRLSNQGQVLIKNKLVPVIGNISMNMTILDVTDLEIAVGEEVILVGPQAGVHPDDLAKICQTANTEITARINPLIVRKLVK